MTTNQERNDLKAMHGLSRSDAPPNLRDASGTPWKKPPTKISPPTNRQRHRTEAEKYDFSNRITGGQKKSGLTRGQKKIDQSNRPIGNVGANALRAYNPNKRQKLDSGPKRENPVLAPESDDELIIVSREPSTDDLNITDTPYLSPTSDSSTKPSSSRLIPDGKNTKWMQMQLDRASAEMANIAMGEDSSDVIETDEIVELPGRDDTVKSKVAKIEEAQNRGNKGPYLDLSKKLKNKMKPKDMQRNTSTLHGDRLISSTQFTKSNNNSRMLSLTSCFLGHKSLPEPLFVKWGAGGELTIHQRVQTGGPKLLAKFRPTDNFDSMTYTDKPEECKNFVLLKITTRKSDPPLVPPTTMFKTGDELAGTLVFKFDDQDEAWSPEIYHLLIDWLKANVKEKNVIRGYAATKSMWEETQRLSDNTNQKSGSASTYRSAKVESKVGSLDTRAVARTQMRLSHENDDPLNTYPIPNSEKSAMTTSNARRRTLRSNAATIKPKSPACDADEVILVYPQGVPGAVNITNADLSRLQPGEFLNDTLIEFGLKYWHRELETTNPELAKQIHVFSSFFYKKLNKKKTEEGYESVRKWTSKFDIFDKKYIIIPINENVHWYLAIIYEPEHTLVPPPPPVNTPTTRRNLKEAITKPPLSRLQAEPTDVGVPGESSMTSDDTASGSGSAEAASMISSTEIALSCVDFQTTVTISSNGETITKPGIPGDLVTVGEATSSNDGGISSPLSPLSDDMDVDDGAAGSRTSRRSSPTVSEMEIEHTTLTVLSRTASLETMDIENMPIPADRFYAQSADKAKTAADSKRRIEQEIFETEALTENECHIPKTYIFTMDSLGSRHPQAVNKLARYLKLEAQDKKQLSEDQTSTATGRPAPVPFQPNYCDCGIYLLHLAKTFMTDPTGYCKKILGTKASVANEERQNVWNDHEVADIREALSDRIRQLSAEWKRERAAREEAKKESKASLDVPDSSDDDEIDIVETTIPKGPTPRKRAAPRPR